MKKRSFVEGAAILAFAGLLVKVLGAIFRIPLTYIIGPEGMGLYQMAYPIYSFLLVISSAGLPVAISKMVSERMAYGNYLGAYRVFKVSLRLLTCLGLSTSMILMALSGVISNALGNPKSVYSILAIAPALFFVSVLSAFRGYFQGMQIMGPTALSQIVEQAGKLFMGLLLAWLFVRKGIEFGAAGAVLGVTLGEIAAFLLLIGLYKKVGLKEQAQKRAIKTNLKATHAEPSHAIIRNLASIAVPVTIGASLMPLVGLIDGMIVVNRLVGIGAGTVALYTVKEATSLYGLLTAYANPLINFPATLTVALAMSIVPSISESWALGNQKEVMRKAAVAIRLTLLVGLPAGVGMSVLSYPIIRLLYRALDDNQAVLAGNLLSILSFGVVFLTLIQSLTGILQGINRAVVPVKNLAIGALVKVVVTYTLVGVPQINIMGAAVGTLVCYAIASLLDFVAVIRYTRAFIPFVDFVVKPMVAVGIMAITVSILYKLMEDAVGLTLATILSILAGIVVYGSVLLMMGTLNEKDFKLLPGGDRLGRFLYQLRIFR
ncbi:stage V sporulation protein B [Caldicoprobacter guelmensis]|uniref:oligosaccharide flippase family protein n=1 Tax=Caldicoprobacter guelmensis TaxID=1170224 RepID=UPI00195965ED|nr:stage V sporulation protein B [Caldicoprobacter guelmensis]